MTNKKLLISLFLAPLFYASFCEAATETDNVFRYPFYIGVTGGYGSTTWNGLMPTEKNQNMAMSLSTPNSTSEGGALWGAYAGYEFIPYFALEAAYLRYPNAKVSFDSISIFSLEHNGQTGLSTHTETISLMGKIMLVIPRTTIRAYSSAGAADVHRRDSLSDHWQLSPTFGVGFNYNITPHIMGELGANYTAGHGEAELDPTKDYIPFLYSVFLRFAYRF